MTLPQQAQKLYAHDWSIRQIAELLKETTHRVTYWISGRTSRTLSTVPAVIKARRRRHILRPKFSALDNNFHEQSWHDTLASDAMSPLEALMAKEDAEARLNLVAEKALRPVAKPYAPPRC